MIIGIEAVDMSNTDDTKRNIKDAFWTLYEKGRLEKITVSAVCKKAGYNRSTFYTYYVDIYEVLDEIEEEVITREDFETIIFKNVLEHGTKESILTLILRMYDAKSQHLTILLGDRGDPAFRSKLLKRIEPILFAMLKCENAKTRRRLRYLIEYQSSGILSIITAWFQQKKPISVEELVEI